MVKTDLFPDQETMEDVARTLSNEHDVERFDLVGRTLTDDDWDRLLEAVLESERVITI